MSRWYDGDDVTMWVTRAAHREPNTESHERFNGRWDALEAVAQVLTPGMRIITDPIRSDDPDDAYVVHVLTADEPMPASLWFEILPLN